MAFFANFPYSTTFKDVCASIREDEAFFTCARRIFESCANMMLNYYAIIRWHEQQNDGSTNENQKFFADVEMRLQKSKKAVYDVRILGKKVFVADIFTTLFHESLGDATSNQCIFAGSQLQQHEARVLPWSLGHDQQVFTDWRLLCRRLFVHHAAQLRQQNERGVL